MNHVYQFENQKKQFWYQF